MCAVYLIIPTGLQIIIESLAIRSEQDILHADCDLSVQSGDWGILPMTETYSIEETAMKMDVLWYSVVERKRYNVVVELKQKEIAGKRLLIGFSTNGLVTVWYVTEKKTELQELLFATSVPVDLDNPTPWNPFISYSTYSNNYSVIEQTIRAYPTEVTMKQFTYRYVIRYERWDDGEEKWERYEEDELQPEFDYIEEMLYDGTHDKLHDGGLLKYHEAGKPKKLALAWHIKKSEYTAYFWFEDERIREVFNRFYGAHPDTKTDFIIRIDPEKRKYELALYRYGLKEPYTIPEDAYQILVFKNKFEDYRSDNYNQERGAWIW